MSRINRISSFQNSNELLRKESSLLLFRDYAKVAAAVEPDAKNEISKPEVWESLIDLAALSVIPPPGFPCFEKCSVFLIG